MTVQIKELTLPGIDGIRHLVTSEDVIKAVSFAVRHAGNENTTDESIDRTAYRFLVAVSMVGALEWPDEWIGILDHVLALEQKDRTARRMADDRPLLAIGESVWYDDDHGTVKAVFTHQRRYRVAWDSGRSSSVDASDCLTDAEHAAVIEG